MKVVNKSYNSSHYISFTGKNPPGDKNTRLDPEPLINIEYSDKLNREKKPKY